MRGINVPRAAILGAALLCHLAASSAQARPSIQIWTDRGDRPVYHEGSAMRVKVRSSMDAYLLVYEIGPDGTISLLHPWKRGSGRIERGHTLRLPPDGADYQLVADELGRGTLVVLASEQPFRDLPWFLRPFDAQAASAGYEGAPNGAGEEDGDIVDDRGRITSPPPVAIERIQRRVLQAGATGAVASGSLSYEVTIPRPSPIFIDLASVAWPNCVTPGTSEESGCSEPSVEREPAADMGSSGTQDPPRTQEPPRPPPVYKSPPPPPQPPQQQPELPARPPQTKPDRPDPWGGKKK